MEKVFRIRAGPAQDSEYRLHEQRRTYEFSIEKMSQRIKMRRVVTLELELRSMPFPKTVEYCFDVLEGVSEDPVSGGFQITRLPIVLKALVALEHRVHSEVH